MFTEDTIEELAPFTVATKMNWYSGMNVVRQVQNLSEDHSKNS